MVVFGQKPPTNPTEKPLNKRENLPFIEIYSNLPLDHRTEMCIATCLPTLGSKSLMLLQLLSYLFFDFNII